MARLTERPGAGYHVHYCRAGGAEHEWLCHGVACAPTRSRACPKHADAR